MIDNVFNQTNNLALSEESETLRLDLFLLIRVHKFCIKIGSYQEQ